MYNYSDYRIHIYIYIDIWGVYILYTIYYSIYIYIYIVYSQYIEIYSLALRYIYIYIYIGELTMHSYTPDLYNNCPCGSVGYSLIAYKIIIL